MIIEYYVDISVKYKSLDMPFLRQYLCFQFAKIRTGKYIELLTRLLPSLYGNLEYFKIFNILYPTEELISSIHLRKGIV